MSVIVSYIKKTLILWCQFVMLWLVRTADSEFTAEDIEFADVRGSGAHGGRRTLEWSYARVMVLLIAIRTFYPCLTGRDEKRMSVWKELFFSISSKVWNAPYIACVYLISTDCRLWISPWNQHGISGKLCSVIQFLPVHNFAKFISYWSFKFPSLCVKQFQKISVKY